MKLKSIQFRSEPRPGTVDTAIASTESNRRKFDPRIDITQQDCAGIDELIERMKDDGQDMNQHVLTYFDLLISLPEYRERLLGDDMLMQGLKDYCRDFLQRRSQYTKAEYAREMGRLFSLSPELFKSLGVEIDFDSVSDIQWSIGLDFRREDYWQLLKSAEIVMMYYPDRKAELGFDDRFFQLIMDKLHQPGTTGMHNDSNLVSLLLIAYPEYHDQICIPHEYFEICAAMAIRHRRVENWDQFIHSVKHLTLFSADQVTADKAGVHTVFEDGLGDTPGLPMRNTAAA